MQSLNKTFLIVSPTRYPETKMSTVASRVDVLLQRFFQMMPELNDEEKKGAEDCLREVLLDYDPVACAELARTLSQVVKTVEDFEVLKLLGTGAQGRVFLVKDKSIQCPFAMKVVPKDNLRDRETMLKREIELQTPLNHPSIASLHAVYQTTTDWYLVQEYLGGGDMFTYIEKTHRPLPLENARSLFRQIAQGIAYLHERGIVHQDIKPENIMFDKEKRHAKIVDFGLGQQMAPGQSTTNEYSGTPLYTAPEKVLAALQKREFETKPCDVWAFGLTLYLATTLRVPFHGTNNNEIFRSITTTPIDFKPILDDALADLLMLLLSREPASRPTIQQALTHPWFTGKPTPQLATAENLPSGSF